ncbi:hypothetical protein [Thermococcus sp.]|uniref:cell wall-binding repeat-containing protein n=1 Tax=Thermococcus sp. TaxID=35749 RepID=UPI00262AC640|nr:hypothetical protein [Thermococcus sp.]
MMWKKGIALLFGVMLMTMGLAFSGVSAASASQGSSVTVILVSDNAADSALAKYIANLTGAFVVTTPWGVYTPNVTAEIMAYAPDQVIIIGGPAAVPEQYVSDLKELNITVERWWGKNRYGTDVAVIGNATVKLHLKFNGSAVIAPGNDSAAIMEAFMKAIKCHGVIIYANATTDPVRIMGRLRIRPINITVVYTPVTRGATIRVLERLQLGSPMRVEKVSVNVTREMALDAIATAKERVAYAEKLLANATLKPREKLMVEKTLNESEKLLQRAEEALNNGQYGKAYGLAIAAEAHADFAVRIASEGWRARLRVDPGMGLRMGLVRIEAQLMIMQKAGINVTQIKPLVEKLEEAIKEGNYGLARSLMKQIRFELMKLYATEKLKFRDHIVFPLGGKHGGKHWKP